MDDQTLRVLEFEKVRATLLSFCCSGLGRRKVEQLAPTSDPESICQWQEETAQMRRLLTQQERLPFSGFRDLSGILEQIQREGHPPEPSQFREIYGVLLAAKDFQNLFATLDANYPRLKTFGRRLQDLPAVYEEIDRVVDPRNSIRTEASVRLQDIRRAMGKLENQIRQKVEQLLDSRSIRKALTENRFAIRAGRCVLPVRLEQRAAIEGIVHDKSNSGSTIYIEPKELVGLGNELSERIDEEAKEQTRLLWELTLLIRDFEPQIARNQAVLAEIELAYAKASMADRFGFETPEMQEEGGLQIIDGRHPLLIEGGGPVVPLGVRVGDGFNALVITGPNTGGKTVAIKTVGLLALMAHCGMPIPAAIGSRVPFLSNIFADIGDEQSIEQSLSTFSGHIRRIIQILAEADNRALVLLDEFGSGTDPAEGAALGEAVLDELALSGASVIITTHIGDLKEYAYSRSHAENASMEFDAATLQPTFRLTIGQPGASNALAIAEGLGLPADVAKAARERLSEETNESTDLIHRMQETRSALEQDRETTSSERKEATRLRREAKEQLKEVQIRGKMLSGEAETVIDETFHQALQSIEPLLAELKAGPAPIALKAAALEEQLRQAFAATPLAEKRLAFIRGLHKNDFVYVPRLGQTLRVDRVDKKRQRLRLFAGSMAMEVGFDDVSIEPNP